MMNFLNQNENKKEVMAYKILPIPEFKKKRDCCISSNFTSESLGINKNTKKKRK